ncbi:MAG: hypothetical protein H5T69_20045 [Chloroflexi bacterium]|nr:hypothetical protein [Chloroflexota bacterium]
MWDYYRFYLTDNLPVGHYTLVLQVADRQGHTGEKKRLAQLTIQAEPVLLADDPQARDVDAVFGEQLRLVEYKLEHRQESLGVSLYWRAEQRMDTDYKVFVHIYDPANGAPVAQDDAMPRRWAYPTRFWWPGELVVDRFDISLREAPPGHYGVAVGVYDPADGRRLDVVRPNGSVSADGRLLLDETVVIAE